jgi:hypothetical protein
MCPLEDISLSQIARHSEHRHDRAPAISFLWTDRILGLITKDFGSVLSIDMEMDAEVGRP